MRFYILCEKTIDESHNDKCKAVNNSKNTYGSDNAVHKIGIEMTITCLKA